ncbi:MAG: alpha amylase N-terminal ig-like domain-containing protein [Spirochaetia bacterium]|nr:alpha amylase N-terminal ig-like domain-containing protein [Spirochaetia bacterium]
MSKKLIDWTLTVCSEVNTDFVSNPYPAPCEEITISIRISPHAPVRQVFIRGISDGVSFRIAMDTPIRKGVFDYYRADVEMDRNRLLYWFEIETADDGYYYHTCRGLQQVPPTEEHDFVIISAFRNPQWVPGAVFYQIFPDRFRNGDPSIGVAEGEYQFDGVMTSVTPWGEAPPEYEEGRCIDFYNGDLAGIEQSIPYFQELHIDALYINPIFCAKTNHRYDCTDYFHVDEHLGGDEAFASLMDKLHAAQMHAVIDVSINHTGIEHQWFQKALHEPESPEAEYYYRLSDGSFVYWFDIPTLPQLNFNSEQLCRRIWQDPDSLIRHYLEPPYSIDGWRFDVANQVGRRGPDQFCHAIWKSVRKAVKKTSPSAYIIGEHWEDPLEYLQGDQWDSAMNYFGSGRPIRGWLGELDRFLMQNWGHDPVTGRKLSAEDLQTAIEQHLTHLPNQLQFLQFNLIDSHDTPRLHHHAAIMDWQCYCGALYLLFTLPGAVSYFYGDEIGLDGHAMSVEGSRYAMEWDRSKWDMEFFTLYSRLGELRHYYRRIFAYGAFRTLFAVQDVYVCARFLEDQAIITIVNRKDYAHEHQIPVALLGAVSGVGLLDEVELSITDQLLKVMLAPKESTMILCRCES